MKRFAIAAALVAALAVALPAIAATPTYKGTVGPGFTITMASKPSKAGKSRSSSRTSRTPTTST